MENRRGGRDVRPEGTSSHYRANEIITILQPDGGSVQADGSTVLSVRGGYEYELKNSV
jgi:hypothetical protein